MENNIQFDYIGEGVFIGLDTHLKNWRVGIVVGEDVYKTFSQPANAATLRNNGNGRKTRFE